jgi:hypothetical protein
VTVLPLPARGAGTIAHDAGKEWGAHRSNQLRLARDPRRVCVGTFGLEGPDKCSGLEVIRYDADSLHAEFGSRFRLVESSKELHRTPFGTTQQFLYCYCIAD